MPYPLAAIGVLLLFVAACGDGSGDGSPTPTPVAAPLSTATSAPSGETLAFLRDGNIRLVHVESGDERALPPTGVESFSWITANELDAVTGTPNEAQHHLLVDLDGHARELPFPAGGSWSRDGSRYVVVINEQVVVFDRGGGEVVRLNVRPPVDTGPKPQNCGEPDELFFNPPVFSADGQRVLVAVSCQSLISATGGLYGVLQDVPFDGAAPRLLPVRIDVGRSSGARVAPEGGRIAVKRVDHASACGNDHSVILLEPDGTTTRELTVAAVVEELSQRTPPGDYWVGGLIDYDWSPAGDALVVSVDVSLCGAGGLEPFLQGLYVFALGASAPQLLAEGPASAPAWSPSGLEIAYVLGDVAGQPGEGTIRIVSASDGHPRTDLWRGSQPAWRPQP